jgi:hypothetical protein
MRYILDGYIPSAFDTRFPFRRDNRRPDGTWAAEDATEDNIKPTSVDPYDPVWPRWRKTPPLDAEGEFVSRDPFFDVDEITQQPDSTRPARRSSTETSTAIRLLAEEIATSLRATTGAAGFSLGHERTLSPTHHAVNMPRPIPAPTQRTLMKNLPSWLSTFPDSRSTQSFAMLSERR